MVKEMEIRALEQSIAAQQLNCGSKFPTCVPDAQFSGDWAGGAHWMPALDDMDEEGEWDEPWTDGCENYRDCHMPGFGGSFHPRRGVWTSFL